MVLPTLTTAELLAEVSTKNGVFSKKETIQRAYAPKHVLNCSAMTPKFATSAPQETERGVMLLHDVFLYQGYYFILPEQTIDYYRVRTNFEKPDTSKQDPSKIIKITEPVCLPLPSKYHHNNYGAFLVQLPPLIQRCLDLDIPAPFMLCNLTSWQQNIINLYFGDTLKIHAAVYRTKELDYSYFFKKVYVPIGAGCCEITDIDLKNHKRITVSQSKNRKTYLARLAKKDMNHRCFINEAEIVDVLKTKGFDIVLPENLTPVEMCKLMQESEYVFGAGGAGMFNTVFCSKDTKVLSIEVPKLKKGVLCTGWEEYHARMFARLELEYSIVIGEPVNSKPDTEQPNFIVDVAKFTDFLKTAYNL